MGSLNNRYTSRCPKAIISVLLSAVLVLSFGATARANVSPLFTNLLLSDSGTLRVGHDVAFDPVDRVYLVVWGLYGPVLNFVGGRLLDVNGAPISNVFFISSGASQPTKPVVRWGSGNFLVVWADGRSGPADIFGQFVGPGGVLVGPNFDITPLGGAQTAPSLAYNSVLKQFLVTWNDVGGALNARTVDTNAAAPTPGPIYRINPACGLFTTLGASSNDGTFFAAWQDCAAAVFQTRVIGATGPIGPVVPFASPGLYRVGGPNTIAFNPDDNEYFLVAEVGGPTTAGWDVVAQRFSPTGTAASAPLPIAFTRAVEQGAGAAYSVTTKSYFVAFMFWDGVSGDAQGVEVSRSGVPIGTYVGLTTRVSGDFGLMATAADTVNARFLTIWNSSLLAIRGAVTQGVAAGPPPPPPAPPVLTITVSGNGTVTSDVGGINCGAGGSACSATYTAGTTVDLTPTPSTSASAFALWTGDAACGDTVVMNANLNCTAVFLDVRPAGLAGQAPITVDNHPDAGADVILYNKITGHWFLIKSKNKGKLGGFNTELFGRWDPGWEPHSADFDGNGLTDILVYNPVTGVYVVALNQGGGKHSFKSGIWARGWTLTIGDFDGNGKPDVFLYNPLNGLWATLLNDGSGGLVQAASGGWDPGWRIHAGNFNNDGKTDLFVYRTTDGTWVELTSNGNGTFTQLISLKWDPNWRVIAADFNGDGLTDLFVYNNALGVWVELFTRTDAGFNVAASGRWDPDWEFVAEDLNGDGLVDLFIYNPKNGNWFEVISKATGAFDLASSGKWSPGWEIHGTDFNHDGRGDLLLYNPVGGLWFKAINNGKGGFHYASGRWSPGWTVITERNR